MSGVVQVVLSDDELNIVLGWGAYTKGRDGFDQEDWQVYEKLLHAERGVACETPR